MDKEEKEMAANDEKNKVKDLDDKPNQPVPEVIRE